MQSLRVILKKIRKGQDFLVDLILRKTLIPIFLFLTYFVAFGLGKLFAMVFARSLVRNKSLKDASFWVTAEGYDPDIEKAKRQS